MAKKPTPFLADPNATLDRINGRKCAESIVGGVVDGDPTQAFLDGFWRHMHTVSGQHLGKSELLGLRVMPMAKAADFEKTVLEFGKHKGRPIADVPIDYLVWLSDAVLDLQAYLRSDRGLRRIDAAGV